MASACPFAFLNATESPVERMDVEATAALVPKHTDASRINVLRSAQIAAQMRIVPQSTPAKKIL